MLLRHPQILGTHRPLVRRQVAVAAVNKGFGAAESKQVAEPAAATAAPAADAAGAAEQASAAASQSKEDEIEALLRRRKNRKGKVEPKVKVESAVVDMATGKTPANAVGEAEGRVLQALAGFFGVLLTEGLLLAGAGFLPAEADSFIQDYLYPSFSPQMLLFLGMSSAYGLWKTGKLPGQQQMK
ncbi:hypothetical protein OEZ85_007718 [Tetradesmus obliquus]|uniref:Cyanobacterial aminoacyl-tRNA synthetase CAAD domain-containing protein n=1 Tax=Tetradesmus obliquus TaxID=3088 RepID=A0ABY8TH01_TETOB|nr:hypothetical protein OEZ85_007718 [Tetradesmus obliquus]